MALSLASTVTLNNGVEIPQLGLGVFRSGAGEGTRNAVRWALEAGYRHIDTAAAYGNEGDVGDVVRESGIARDELFITTKLWRDDFGYDGALSAFDGSLRRLGLEYVDLYLLHWPEAGKRLQAWRALETIAASGRCRAIGVSNFTERHLVELLDACDVVPAVNQIELHPFWQRDDTVPFCREHGIAVEAWGPLVKGQRLDDPAITALAERLGVTAAQLLIRWSLQKGYICIPKSVNRERIAQNADVFGFELDADAMARLEALDDGYRTAPGWDPTKAD